MSHASAPARFSQPVLVVRLTGGSETVCPYADTLHALGFNLRECGTPEAASAALRNGFRVGLLVITHEPQLAELSKWKALTGNGDAAWVALVAQHLFTLPRMREWITEHLFNFIPLPADPAHIALTLRDAWRMAAMRDTRRVGVPAQPHDADWMMIGKTPQMQQLFGQLQKVARSDASVLISGPSGTGKELAALSIHRQSARRDAPFVAVNCGAIAPSQFRSELFGYETEAFTGGHQRKIGRLEAAQGGTLFFDEIGDMPLDMQGYLLRFLQEKAAERISSDGTLAVDVRIIATTHINLAEAVRQGYFREDLYYRINVVCVAMPPLADRGQDIEDIAKHYFSKFASAHNRSLRGFSKAAMHAMLSHPWPGNVRELANRVQRATMMAEGRFIQPEDLGFERHGPQTQLMSLEEARANAERIMIQRALAQSRNQVSRAAALLGVSRVTLYRLIEKYHIRAQGLPASPYQAQIRGASILHR